MTLTYKILWLSRCIFLHHNLKNRSKGILMILKIDGQRFSRLVVLKYIESVNKRRHWLCQCDCGKTIIVAVGNLRSGNTKSCGCLKSESLIRRNFKHGYTFDDYTKNHPLYAVFKMMKSRCYNITSSRYSDYGGRGIKICDDWLSSVGTFIKWAIQHGWRSGLQIDRIENDGDYRPTNCRFVTAQVNNQNKRIYKSNKTGYSGVFYNRENRKFISSLSYLKKRYHIGSFDTAFDACIARNKFITDNNFNIKTQMEIN